MSLQDESFPYDDLDISRSSGKNFVFPHHKPRRNTLTKNDKDNEDGQHNALTTQEILSASLQEKDESTQSSIDCCPPSETSGKTSVSEPNDLEEARKKKSEFVRNNTNKSTSYQDIHSESTKRRYKHVPSKVGQYIANIKAEDEKRRNSGKFQRHRSMPETLHGTESTILEELRKDSATMRHSTNDLDRMHNGDHHELQSDHELENYDNLTATTSSSSTRDLGPDAGIFLDKHAYEQLLDRKDYLQTMLEEKNAENWRLKQNLEKMRIDYTMCKDKLNQQILQPQKLTGSFGSINAAACLGRNSLQCLLYPQETKEKSTQTEKLLTPSPVPPLLSTNTEMFATPLTPDSNNNSFDHAAVGMLAPAPHKVAQKVAHIQPLALNFSNFGEQDSRDFNTSSINNTMGYLRQRSNSIAARKKSTPLPMNISKVSSVGSSMPSSSDSAIDIEVAESPKSQRQSRREEFIYNDKRSQRYAVLETRNAEQSYTDININSSLETTIATMNGDDRRVARKRHNLRSRMMRFFGSCTKCEDPNTTVDSNGNSQRKSYSQIPLLEKSSKNTCRNVR